MQVYLKKQNFFFRKTLIVTAVIVVAIIALNIFQLQIKNIFYTTSLPISTALWQAGEGITHFFDPFINVKKIQGENVALQTQNQQLLLQVASLKDSVLSQQEYQAAKQSATQQNFSVIAAKVTGLAIGNDMATVNKGLADGIKENMPLISSQNVLYGKVVKVYKNSSDVMLVSHKQSVTNVKVVDAV